MPNNNIPGITNSPPPAILAAAMVLKSSAPVMEFDSLQRQNARALDVGSQGNVNAYKILGLIVG